MRPLKNESRRRGEEMRGNEMRISEEASNQLGLYKCLPVKPRAKLGLFVITQHVNVFNWALINVIN